MILLHGLEQASYLDFNFDFQKHDLQNCEVSYSRIKLAQYFKHWVLLSDETNHYAVLAIQIYLFRLTNLVWNLQVYLYSVFLASVCSLIFADEVLEVQVY